MIEEFYFLIEGKRKGPYSISEIKNQKDLNIHRETSAWQVGSDDSWKNAIEYESLGFLPPAPPPTQFSKLKGKLYNWLKLIFSKILLVWVLCVVMILLEGLTLYMLGVDLSRPRPGVGAVSILSIISSIILTIRILLSSRNGDNEIEVEEVQATNHDVLITLSNNHEVSTENYHTLLRYHCDEVLIEIYCGSSNKVQIGDLVHVNGNTPENGEIHVNEKLKIEVENGIVVSKSYVEETDSQVREINEVEVVAFWLAIIVGVIFAAQILYYFNQ